MKKYLYILIFGFAAAALSQHVKEEVSDNTKYYISSKFVLTNDYHWKSPVLVLTNRQYIQVNGAVLIKFSDAEWQILTNKYKENIKTNNFSFYPL